jgi:hypothetical protein
MQLSIIIFLPRFLIFEPCCSMEYLVVSAEVGGAFSAAEGNGPNRMPSKDVFGSRTRGN